MNDLRTAYRIWVSGQFTPGIHPETIHPVTIYPGTIQPALYLAVYYKSYDINTG